jgi:hypothetical protein
MAAWVWRRGDGSGGLEEGRQQRGRRGGATYGRGRGGRGSEERYTDRRRGPTIGPISVAHQATCVTERYNFVACDNTCATEIVKPMIRPDRGGAHHISVAHVRGVCHINQIFLVAHIRWCATENIFVAHGKVVRHRVASHL